MCMYSVHVHKVYSVCAWYISVIIHDCVCHIVYPCVSVVCMVYACVHVILITCMRNCMTVGSYVGIYTICGFDVHAHAW